MASIKIKKYVRISIVLGHQREGSSCGNRLFYYIPFCSNRKGTMHGAFSIAVFFSKYNYKNKRKNTNVSIINVGIKIALDQAI